MNSTVIPDESSIAAIVSRLADLEITAFVVVYGIGQSADASVAALISPEPSDSATFRHAIEREVDYSESLLDFDEDSPPYHGENGLGIDLEAATRLLGDDLMICLITQDRDAQVSVVRDYVDLEYTQLEATKIQLQRCIEILDGHTLQ